MNRGRVVKLLLAALLLILAWRVYIPVSRCLSDFAPVLRWKLHQTHRSLPKAPEGVTLLARYEAPEGGSDCNAFAIEEIYGTERPLENIASYYQSELLADGWTQLYEYRPGQYGVVGFKRGRDEFLELLTSSSLDVRSWIRIPLQERLAQFSTVYVLNVTRTCGLAELEQ